MNSNIDIIIFWFSTCFFYQINKRRFKEEKKQTRLAIFKNTKPMLMIESNT